MTREEDDGSAKALVVEPVQPAVSAERASESVVSGDGPDPAGLPKSNAVSSSPILIPRDAIAPESVREGSAPPPPSAVAANATARSQAALSLGAIVGIGCGVFAVLVGLTLLLFR